MVLVLASTSTVVALVLVLVQVLQYLCEPIPVSVMSNEAVVTCLWSWVTCDCHVMLCHLASI